MTCTGCFCKANGGYDWCHYGCLLPHRDCALWFWYPWPDTKIAVQTHPVRGGK
jgi:hypothetical protein